MSTSDERVREIIAIQAGEWFLAHRSGGMEAVAVARFYEWLTSSPLHVEEYLGVARVASLLPTAADDPESPLEAILERVRGEGQSASFVDIQLQAEVLPVRERKLPRWAFVAVPAMVAMIALALLWWRSAGPMMEHYATRHGQLKSVQLSDNSTLHLNTETDVTVRYSGSQRFVNLVHGEALFEVVPQVKRAFRVAAGTTNIVAVGTAFAVRQDLAATLVTVVRGRVAVWTGDDSRSAVEVDEGYAVRVLAGQTPGSVVPADVSRATAWLHRQIIFEREPLAAVASEFNRYSPVPIEIETPALRTLPVSGVFSVDDTDTFLDFLRSLEGVSIASTATRIRVYQSVTPSSRRQRGRP